MTKNKTLTKKDETIIEDNSFSPIVNARNDKVRDPREHIETLYHKKNNNDENSTTLAQMLEQDTSQLFHQSHNFLHELLQNADDANATELSFFLVDNELTASHNGEHFKENDVDRICNAAKDSEESEESKPSQSEKIGYKGIGFKSVFALSEKVIILSKEYKFKFDKSHSNKQKSTSTKSKYPWQIIPIYYEKTNFKNFDIDLEKVNFILKNVNKQKIKNSLKRLIQSKSVLLFLNNIKKLTFNLDGEVTSFNKAYLLNPDEIGKKTPLIQITITHKNNPPILTQWLTHTITDIKIDEFTKEKLQSLDNISCPHKYKTKKNIQLSFAIQVKKHSESKYEFIPIANNTPSLYCYLPTAVCTDLPFLINTSFILSKDREQVIQHIWNTFLFEQLGYYQFRWFEYLSKTKEYCHIVLDLLTPIEKLSIDENSMIKAYAKGYESAKKEVSFILTINNSYTTLNNCIIDETKFFHEKKLLELFSEKEIKNVVSPLLKKSITLLNFSSNQHTWDNLTNQIENYC